MQVFLIAFSKQQLSFTASDENNDGLRPKVTADLPPR
jgi:hypothetical protein